MAGQPQDQLIQKQHHRAIAERMRVLRHYGEAAIEIDELTGCGITLQRLEVGVDQVAGETLVIGVLGGLNMDKAVTIILSAHVTRYASRVVFRRTS